MGNVQHSSQGLRGASFTNLYSAFCQNQKKKEERQGAFSFCLSDALAAAVGLGGEGAQLLHSTYGCHAVSVLHSYVMVAEQEMQAVCISSLLNV